MKAVTMYHPNVIRNVLSDFDRCFESFFGDSILTPVERIFNNTPAVDIRETEKAYVMEMELPGYDEKNIDVHIDGSHLSIASKQEETREDKKEKDSNAYILRERRLNSFRRSFKLPDDADPATVNAVFKNGILIMEIQKRLETQKRAIQISTA